MASYSLSNAAQSELKEIYAFTVRTFGIQQADRYLDQLHAGAQMAADFPLIGRLYTSSDDIEYRRYYCGRRTLFYRIEEGAGITIDRIIHQARDLDRLL